MIIYAHSMIDNAWKSCWLGSDFKSKIIVNTMNLRKKFPISVDSTWTWNLGSDNRTRDS